VRRNGYDDTRNFIYVAHGTEPALILEAIWQCLLKFHDRYSWNDGKPKVLPEAEGQLFKVSDPHNGYCRQTAQTKLAVWQARLDALGSTETIGQFVLRMLQTNAIAVLNYFFTEEGLPMGTTQDVVKICASVGLHVPHSLGLDSVKQWVQPYQ